jgi:hypothetical protein
MKRLSPFAIAAAALAACSSSDTTRLSVRLTDAPGDVVAAVVTITRISLQGEGGETVLSAAPTTVSLLELANEATTLVEDAVVPRGRYEQLRFHVSGGYVEVEGDGGGTLVYASSPDYEGLPPGTSVAGLLKMPSYAQSGLKVTLPGDALVLDTDAKILLVDFDVAQSFGHEAGGSGSWVMHPVVKGADLRVTGTAVATLALAPGVTLPALGAQPTTLGQFVAVLLTPPPADAPAGTPPTREEQPFANVGGVWTAAFRFLLPGDYALEVVGPAGLSFETAPASPAPVAVGGGAESRVDWTITSATAP